MSAPAAESGWPCVETLFSYDVPSAATAPLPITVRPMMIVGRSVSAPAVRSAARISSTDCPSTWSTFQPQALYLAPTSSVSTSSTLVESWMLFES